MLFYNKFIRKTVRYLSILIVLLILSPLVATAGDVTVLIYHRFGDPRYPSTNVSLENFKDQLSYLKENNYRVMPLAEMVQALKQGNKLPEKAAVITIDDGYKTVYDKAWPILKSFGYPFTVFLYVKGIDKARNDYMNWDQVREMQAAGVDVQSHGYGHYHLANKPDGMDNETYRAWLRSDLSTSSLIMAKQLGKQPEFFAVPYGEYNQTVINEARDLGYKAALMQDPGSVSEQTDPFLIPREPILGETWSTMGHFKTILNRVDLPVSDLTPGIGIINDPSPKRFGARLLYPEKYRPGTIGIYVSELGWQQAEVKNGFASIRNYTPLTRRINRVAISGREKETGRTAIRFWLLVQEEKKEEILLDPAGMIMKKDKK